MSATLEGTRVTHGRLVLPYSGIWHADVVLDGPTLLSGAVTLVLGGLSMKGYIAFGDVYQGIAKYLVIGGAGGWRKSIPARGYANSTALLVSTLVKDAATECGETVSFLSGADRTVGPGYTRAAAPAVRTLTLLADTWWLDANGVTQVGARPAGDITTVFDLVAYEPEDRRAVLASETPEVFEIGKTLSFSSAPSMTVGSIVHLIDEAQLRTELLAA